MVNLSKNFSNPQQLSASCPSSPNSGSATLAPLLPEPIPENVPSTPGSLCSDDSQTTSTEPSSGFEGPEKKLEVEFRFINPANALDSNGFRAITRAEWDDVLKDAQCTILSVCSNECFDAYLLSESSLFVYPSKLMIKTCGTTTLLRALPRFMALAKRVGLEYDFLKYSRASFKYPKQQLFPHTSFETEVAYLNQWFSGEAYVLGTEDQNCTQWHLYIADASDVVTAEQTFEVFMFDLDQEAMSHYFRDQESEVGHEFAIKRTTPESGISTLVEEGALIDAFNFDPCGYSMNALYKDVYYTIHITPESHCSYASFECNLPAEDFTDLLARVVQVFKPGSFTVAHFSDRAAPAGNMTVKYGTPKSFAKVGHKTFVHNVTGGGKHQYCASLSSFKKEHRPKPASPSTVKIGSHNKY